MCIVAWNPWFRAILSGVDGAIRSGSLSTSRPGVVGSAHARRTAPGRPLEASRIFRPADRGLKVIPQCRPLPWSRAARHGLESRRGRPPVLVSRGGVREQESSMIPHLDDRHRGRSPRGMPRRGVPWRRRLLALGLIAGLVVIQAGCQSGPFSSCGTLQFLRLPQADHRSHPPPRFGLLRHGDHRRCGRGRLRGTFDGGRAGDDGRPMYSTGPASGSVPSTVVPDTPPTLDAVPKAKAVPYPGTSSSSGSGATKASTFMRPSSSRSAARLDTDPSTRPVSGSSTSTRSSSRDGERRG